MTLSVHVLLDSLENDATKKLIYAFQNLVNMELVLIACLDMNVFAMRVGLVYHATLISMSVPQILAKMMVFV
jgi:hypothetical protein